MSAVKASLQLKILINIGVLFHLLFVYRVSVDLISSFPRMSRYSFEARTHSPVDSERIPAYGKCQLGWFSGSCWGGIAQGRPQLHD